MRPLWSRALGVLQVLAGIGLIGWAVLFYGLAGWGVNLSDLEWNVSAILPWLSPLALGPVLMARRSAQAWRRLKRVAALCAAAVAVAALIALAERIWCVWCPGLLPWPLLLLLIPFTLVVYFLGFFVLAVPALAARTRVGRVVGWVPFALGFAIVVYPPRFVSDHTLREWLLATVAMLVLLGIGFVAVGVAALRARRSP